MTGHLPDLVVRLDDPAPKVGINDQVTLLLVPTDGPPPAPPVQEIADQLVISVATVKRHIANTYGKLGVGHRTEAVARAGELDLL